MVNSSSLGCEENGNRKASCIQTNSFHSETQSSSPITASSATQSRNDFMRTADINLLCKTDAVEPTPSKTDSDGSMTISYNSVIFPDGINGVEADKTKKSFFCSVPLEKVQTILSTYTSFRCDGDSVKICRKVLCLYCDRTFVNVNLRQKHIERCHSAKQLRRVSLRKHQNCLTSTPCIYCDKFTSTTHTLKELFEHLIVSHSNKYFGCLSCEDRYYDFSHLTDHNALCHNLRTLNQETPTVFEDNGGTLNATQPECQKIQENFFLETTRSKQQKTKFENKLFTVNPRKLPGKLKTDVVETKKTTNVKNLRGKKFSVKSSRIIIKRSKRLQAKLNGVQQKKHTKEVDKKDKNSKYEQAFSTKLNEKSAKSSNSVNPYPEFDNFFQVKKITDHSIDNLKISSLTFDDVFDKAFFNRIKCNIQENLLHHIDGKLFKNEESESRISNFEKNSNVSQEVQNLNAENYGCELSLNAIAPTTLLLSSQFGEDPESQIEYGSKPSKKKAQIKKDEVHYKYFTRRKYQASILERKENRDLSKLDMWTQYIIKNRQQKVLDDKKSPKEILDYFSGEEYKNLMKREELNRILDRRGPFEDLREEVSKKAALDKLNGETENCINDDSLVEVGELLNDILNNVFELTKKETCLSVQNYSKDVTHFDEDYVAEIPSYLNLRRTSSLPSDSEIDKSDKIALICSSQETENFELPSNRVRGKNEKVELTGEWARSRIYVCAACGLKLQNIKQFLEHKSTSHQYVWVQHYEFVGNQSELYRHLSIPVLGKVGVLEKLVQCKMWKRSDARSCTKCGKQCNSLGELHRHILECGGDWTWMLVRKKYKYRPFGAKSRRKRRGLVKRIYTQKTEPSEKKMYKKSFDLPRQKASDADTIQRMLANLPPKRTTRKIICLKDGFSTSRNKQVKATKQSKFKCGKLIHGKGKEQNKNTTTRYKRTNKNQQNNYRRSLRCLNKVLTSRILDTNSSLLVRKKYKKKMKKQDTKAAGIHINKKTNEPTAVSVKKAVNTNNSPVLVNKEATLPEQLKSKRSSPRIEKLLEFNCVRKTLMDTMNVKRFFPVKKKKRIEDSKPVHEKKSATKRKVTETQDKKVIKQNIEEIKNSLQNVKSLRKRKRESKSVESSMTNKPKVKKKAVDGKAEASDKKRNLRNRLTVAKADAAANSSCEQDDCTQTKLLPFLEEIVTKDELAVELLPTPSEPIIPLEDKEKSCNLPLPAEDQEKQNKINLPITEDENMKYENIVTGANVNNCTNVIVEKNKKKIRKPARGLNDCIAMLTNKLNKNLEDSSANVMSICSYQSNSIDEESKKSEHILKSIVNKSEQIEPILPDLNETKAEIGKEEVDDVVESSNENKKENCVSVNCKQIGGETSLLENETILTEHKLTESDSEDEIPLSTLLKEDQCSLITDSDNNQNASAECDDVGKNVVENNVTITEKTSPQTVNQENTVDLNLLIDTNGAEEALNGRTSGFGCFASHEIKSNDFDEVKELRRSKRNSKKIASYNEIDLVDPLLDDLDRCKGISSIIKETTKNLFLDKPPKNNQKHSHKKIKNDSKDMKLSGDELFDLLKAKPDENVLSKPTNSFFNNFDEISNEFTNDNFDVLEDILEKSIAVIEENLTEKVVNLPSNSLEIQKQILNESASDSEAKTEPALDSGVKAESPLKKNESNSSRSKTKKKSKNSKHRKYQRRLLGEEIENKLNTIEKNGNFNDFENISKDSFNNNSVDNSRLQCNKINKVDPVQRCESDKNKVNYCEICNKFFCRVESLTKHKRTLTHISKLSELEAREAALKAKENELNENDRLVEVIEMADSRRNLNLLDILETIETTDCKQSSPFTVDMNNSNLKLADIINDVLNKPVLKKSADKHSFSNIIENSNGMQSEMKRYKSLAERKSFESENRPVKKSVDYFEPEISNTAGTILEKQITLLENIIENRSNLSYIDDLTITSSQSVNENISADHGLNITFPRQDDSIHAYPDQCGLDNNLMKSNLEEESFLKPSQYEEISEDSNLRNYDEQKSRKALNRDEELFLECCSLLKSGSEISNYSKKSTNAGKDLNNLEMKRCDEPEWLQNGCLSQKESDKAGEYFSDNSRVTTPLGDNFSQDESNSATISSHWNMNLKNKTYSGEFDLKDKNFTSFEKVFSSDGPTEDVFSSGQNSEEAPHMTVSSFDDAIRVRLDATDAETEERNATNLEDYYEEKKIELIADNKKMLTKGAMKVFEGLKVSIPTEDLNMAKILTCSPPVKKSISTDFTETKPAESINISRLERKSGLKRKKKVTTKSSQSKKPYNPGKASKIHDIYDFEETQDNSDVFTRPDFRSFRNNHEKSRKIEKPMDSDNDNSQDAVSVDAFSSSTSSVSELVPNQVKSKTQQNITKKKCMIMGRIFKNAVKSRIIDENIRNIPIIDNAKLVEDFVLSCPEPAINHLEKSKMTEEEMNMAFDKLVNSDSNNELKQIVTESCSSNEKNGNKNNYNKKKSKSKNKKRSHTYSDSSDDEFKLQKSSKKRIKKKNNKIEDNCINLEQELKECIGVASRKSQRKCTSGKQNVLIEYWSSDESLLETELDSKMLETAILVDKSDYHLSKEAPSKFPEMAKFDEKSDCEEDARTNEKQTHKRVKSSSSTYALNRRKRAAVNPLYHWSSSSEDESRDLIEIKPIRDEIDDDEDRPIQHGWIVGDSPKKLVTMLAQAK
ncbi:microtubule-associated protein futsch, partial [Asbolus verrucosus]